jgi:hypothetical protein
MLNRFDTSDPVLVKDINDLVKMFVYGGQEAIESAAYGFLCKPFTDYDLIAAIDELISDL